MVPRLFYIIALVALLALPAMAEEAVVASASGLRAQLEFSFNGSVTHTAEVRGRVLTLRFSSPMLSRMDDAIRTINGFVEGVTSSVDRRSFSFGLTGRHQVSSRQEGNKVILTITASALPTTPPAVIAPAAPTAEVATPDSTLGDWPIRWRRGAENITAEVRLRETVPLAVFRRQQTLWLVFGVAGGLRVNDVPPELATDVQTVGGKDVSALLLKDVKLPFRGAELRDNFWVLTWSLDRQQVELPAQDLPTEVREDPPGKTIWRAELDAPNPVIRLSDPQQQDEVAIIPSRNAGYGISERQRLPEFDILPSPVGIALVPKIDDLSIAVQGQALVVSTPDGLSMSRDIKTGVAVALPDPLFNWREWRQAKLGDQMLAETTLERKVALATPEFRGEERLRLVQFLFAYGRFSEAAAALRLLKEESSALWEKPEVFALRGVASYLAGDRAAALPILSSPLFNNNQEMALWRGIVAAEEQRYAAALDEFRDSQVKLEALPEPLRVRTLRLMLETALASNDIKGAQTIFLDLKKNPSAVPVAGYWHGKILAAQGDTTAAIAAFERAVASGDEWTQPRATLALMELKLTTKQATLPDVIAALEKLRYTWRGDYFEANVLDRLAELYQKNNDPRGALLTLEQRRKLYADEAGLAALEQKIQQAFMALFGETPVQVLPTLETVSIFKQFERFVPDDASGDAMVLRLAARLADVDLMTRSAQMLSERLEKRRTSPARGELGFHLARYYALDRLYEQALTTLDDTADQTTPVSLQADRKNLRARVLFEMNRIDEALRLLAEDASPEAAVLRAEVFWQQRQWPLVISNLSNAVEQKLSQKPFDETTAQLVFNWAVALVMDQDTAGLITLRQRFGKQMEQSALASGFSLMTSGDDTVMPVSQRLKLVEQAQNFMGQLRRSQLAPKTSP